MSDLIGFIFYLGCVICWFKAVIFDIANSNLVWCLVDFFIAPIGVLRGLILFFN